MSQIKPKSLRLDFENIDWCKIPIKMVTDLKIYNIHHEEFVSYPESNNYASRNIHTIADNVQIKLDINMIEKAKLSTNYGIPIIERIRGGHDIYYVALVDEKIKNMFMKLIGMGNIVIKMKDKSSQTMILKFQQIVVYLKNL